MSGQLHAFSVLYQRKDAPIAIEWEARLFPGVGKDILEKRREEARAHIGNRTRNNYTHYSIPAQTAKHEYTTSFMSFVSSSRSLLRTVDLSGA